jgi:hypothetical protein
MALVTLLSVIIFISQLGGATACSGGCVCSHVPIGCCDSWSANGVDSATGLLVADSGMNESKYGKSGHKLGVIQISWLLLNRTQTYLFALISRYGHLLLQYDCLLTSNVKYTVVLL